MSASSSSAALADPGALFRAVFERARFGIGVAGNDDLFIEVNAAMCTLLGRTREQLIGLPAGELIAPERGAELAANWAEFRRSGHWRGVLPVRRPDGTQVQVEWDVSDALMPGVRLVMATDAGAEAERQRLLESERSARLEAERANRAKDDFLATVSHELRNPLSVIVGWSEVLARKSVEPQVAEGLKAIASNARLQVKLIGDLLDVSRITSGKLRLAFEILNPVAIVEHAIHTVQAQARAKDIHIATDLDRAVPAIAADPTRLQQVLLNLLSNAIKFSDNGAAVHVSLARSGSFVELKVEDAGRGVAPDFLPHIFERFKQQQSGKAGGGGLGLGLAIAKTLVEMHGGVIRAHSDGEGKGAVFTVLLPAAQAVAQAPVDLLPASLQELQVLLVEDDAGARALASRVLSEAGAQVTEAGGVAAALDALARSRPSIIVSDIGMSPRDGHDFMREVRKTYSAEQLPAVALTAFARREDRMNSLQAGYQAHLIKPVDAQELLSVVSSLCATRGAPAG